MSDPVKNMSNVLSKGKDVKNTSQLDTNAQEASDFKETNKLVQYVAPNPNVSGAGGEGTY